MSQSYQSSKPAVSFPSTKGKLVVNPVTKKQDKGPRPTATQKPGSSMGGAKK